MVDHATRLSVTIIFPSKKIEHAIMKYWVAVHSSLDKFIDRTCWHFEPWCILKDPEYEWLNTNTNAWPIRNNATRTLHPKRARRNAKLVPWSSSDTEKQPEQWRASTSNRNTSLHKNKPLRLTCLQLHY